MKYLLKEFKDLLIEENTYPKDELRDYYLVPARTLMASNPAIANQVLDYQTPLMMVIQTIVKKNNDIIRETHLNQLAWEAIELTNKKSINYQNKDGNSVIHLTCGMECFSVGLLDLMKEFGANFSLLNKKNETPLLMVSDSESLDDLKFIHAYTDLGLIDQHDNVTGATALIKAVKAKKMGNLFFLLEQGANMFEKDFNNMNAIDYVKENKKHPNEELYQLFNLFTDKLEQEKKRISSLKENK